jgi:hypothetical protein
MSHCLPGTIKTEENVDPLSTPYRNKKQKNSIVFGRIILHDYGVLLATGRDR